MALNEKPSTATIILDTLIKHRLPLNLYQLAKKSGLTHQRIRYVLPKLIIQGLVVPVKNGSNISYTVQAIHTDRKLIKEILTLTEPIVKTIYNKLELEHLEDHEEALAQNLALFISKQIVVVK